MKLPEVASDILGTISIDREQDGNIAAINESNFEYLALSEFFTCFTFLADSSPRAKAFFIDGALK
jgi:hypothetical protein